MNLGSRWKRQLSRLVLRGRVFDAWMARKSRRLEQTYCTELLRASTGRPARTGVPALQTAAPVRRLLFISDIMWESKELVPELQKICEIETLDLRPLLQQAPESIPPRTTVANALRALTARAGQDPDVILFYARAALLSDEAFAALRARWKCPLLGMNLDEKIEFLPYGLFSQANDDYRRWAVKFDLNLSNVRAVADWYSDCGFPAYYMPEGFHPRCESPRPGPRTYEHELSFVGSKKPERETLMRRLRALGLPVKPLGFGWPDSSGGAQPEIVYRASLMNLGIGYASPSQALTTLKTRDFECPGAGACYLTTWNWELALHYDIGREILCYRNEEELVELFSFYRRRPDECSKIALAAWTRCRTSHTWEKRFRDLFGQLGWLK